MFRKVGIKVEEQHFFKLNNGVLIPAVGFGTGIVKGLLKHPKSTTKRFLKESIKNIVVPGFKENNVYPIQKDLKKEISLKKISKKAYSEGCRLFDTARAYQYSEQYLGDALFRGANRILRQDCFIISKVTNTAQRNHTVWDDLEQSLNALGTEYIDLYLMHWPQPGAYLDTWKVMEEMYASGKVRAIGVSNCHVHHLDEIMNIATVMPMADELECHPLLQQKEVRTFCKGNGIQLIAYAPIGKMNAEVRNNQYIKAMCNKYHVEPAQVILRWHYQKGDVSIPNTTNSKHVGSNYKIWNFSLNEEEMSLVESLDCGYRIWPDPDNCNFNNL